MNCYNLHVSVLTSNYLYQNTALQFKEINMSKAIFILFDIFTMKSYNNGPVSFTVSLCAHETT
jgi:hypothetical protein